MYAKLTLRLEATLIEKAKVWAKKHNVSLSQAVAEFFAQLPEKDGQRAPSSLSPWTRRLVGMAAGKGKTPEDEEVRRDYIDSLEANQRF